MELTFELYGGDRIWYTAVYPCRRRNRGHTHHVVRGDNLDAIKATVTRRGGLHLIKSVPTPPLSADELTCSGDGSSPPGIMMLDDLQDLRGDLCGKDERVCCLVQ